MLKFLSISRNLNPQKPRHQARIVNIHHWNRKTSTLGDDKENFFDKKLNKYLLPLVSHISTRL